MGTRDRTVLVGARCTLVMQCHVAETWDEQGNDCLGCVSGIATAPGLDVTSCRIKNPSITPFFLIAYLE
jgi:hypothetical protein